MNKRPWIWSTVILAVFALAITALELGSEQDYKKSILSARLEGYADVVARSQDYDGAVRWLPEDIRVSVVSPEGEVVYDSYQGEVQGSHLDRPEIQACLSGSEGCSIRRSGTSGIEYIYFAKRYGDVIVRTAMPFELAQKRFMHPDWTLLITIGLLFLLAALLTRRLSLRADAQAKEATDEQLQTQKKRITGNLAHELRTPVTSIRGYLETLVDNPQMDEAKKGQFIDRAYRQTLRLSDLIRDISLITKMEEAPQTLKKEHLGMRHLTCEVLDEFAGTIAEQGVKVENTIADDVCILGNQSLLYALLRNLVENSLRYGGQGITIHIECKVSDRQANFLYYDTGKGVSDEHLGKIFERFYRIPEEDSHRSEGSGLGLSIVKNAVAFHRGTISAHHLQPHGLAFRFSLPVE
ncbi:MAG: sensor histidine kinase [Candidatus Cryptobacteroides sp.]